MNNNMLGLTIVRINNGYTNLLEINGNQSWTKNVWDIRKDLENIDNFDGASTVLMLTSIDTGHIVSIAYLIDGRINDCISAWIYIPATIAISGKELVETIDATRKEILANVRNDEHLNQLFSKAFPAKPASSTAVSGNGDKCAYRYYGQGAKYTLAELLNERNQSYYNRYKSIFLLDNATKLKCKSGDNLTEQKVVSMILLNTPGVQDSFVPHIDGKPFVGQMYANEGDTIKIEWRRDGFMSIQTETVVVPGAKYSLPTRNQYKRLIPHSSITVLDEWGSQMSNYKLYIADKLIEKGKAIPLSESVAYNAPIEIRAEGYETIKGYLNLTQKNPPIKLKKQSITYEFLIPLIKGGYESIKITGMEELKKIPFEGFSTNDDLKPNKKIRLCLKKSPSNNTPWIICIVISILFLLLGFGIGYICFADDEPNYGGRKKYTQNEYSSENTTHNSGSYDAEIDADNKNVTGSGTEVANTMNADDTDSHDTGAVDQDAINYLDDNQAWIKGDMEKFESLRGLWDAMNEYDFETIKSYSSKLEDSEKFKELIQAIKNCTRKFTPGSKFYTEPGDTTITFTNYINAIKRTEKKTKEVSKPNRQIKQSDFLL